MNFLLDVYKGVYFVFYIYLRLTTSSSYPHWYIIMLIYKADDCRAFITSAVPLCTNPMNAIMATFFLLLVFFFKCSNSLIIQLLAFNIKVLCFIGYHFIFIFLQNDTIMLFANVLPLQRCCAQCNSDKRLFLRYLRPYYTYLRIFTSHSRETKIGSKWNGYIPTVRIFISKSVINGNDIIEGQVAFVLNVPEEGIKEKLCRFYCITYSFL